MKLATLVGGEKINAHDPASCDPDWPCAVHRPSTHRMSAWPQHYRSDCGLMERICHHDIGHPDPDHMLWLNKPTGFVTEEPQAYRHGCDGCCGVP